VTVDKNKITAAAQKFTAKGQFEKAIAEYRKLVKEDANDIRTWLKMGDLYTRMGARKEATDTYIRVAEHYKKSGFHLKAVAVYKQVIKLDPALGEVYELLAEAYLSLGLTSEALIQLEQLADMFQRAGNSERMLAALQRMADLDVQNISTRLRIAEQHSKDGRAAEAVRHFAAACDLLRQQGRIDDFLKVAERLLYHDASQIEIARETASIYLEKNQPKRALAKLQLCFAKEPRNVDTLDLLAQAFCALGQPDKAVSVYNEIAAILGEQRREDDRRRVYQRILELDPKNASALTALGPASEAPAPAARADTAHRASPSSAPAAAPLASTSPEIAEEITEETLAAKAAKLLGEAEVLIKYGLVDRAREHFRKIFEFDYYNLDARERLKDLLLDAGDREGAIEQLFVLADGFIEEQPEGAVYFLHQILGIDPFSRKARELLQRIGGVMPAGLPALPEDGADVIELGPSLEAGGADLGGATLAPEIAAPAVDEVVEEPAAELDDITDVEEPGDLELDELPAVDDELFADEEEVPVEAPTAAPKKALSLPAPRVAPAPSLPAPRIAPLPSVPEPKPAPKPAAPPRPAPEPVRPAPEPVRPAPEPVRPAAPAPAEVEDISEELEEIDFFISQGLNDEALPILEALAERLPDDPRIAERIARLRPPDLAPGGITEPAPPIAKAFDLGALSGDLDLSDVTQDDISNEIDAVFSQFKAGVEKQVSKSDYATHYDLGVAYREMGLTEDAIAEFRIAAGDHKRATAADTMIGACQTALGRFDEALATLQRALDRPGLTEGERLAVRYEIAKAYEAQGRKDDALAVYNEILLQDPGFADVVDRIDAIES
jgi:tetratricopeptide (TPR) repeat protein